MRRHPLHICDSDVVDDGAHEGFCDAVIPLVEWKRYRHETYKEKRQDDMLYIRAPAGPAGQNLKWPNGALGLGRRDRLS